MSYIGWFAFEAKRQEGIPNIIPVWVENSWKVEGNIWHINFLKPPFRDNPNTQFSWEFKDEKEAMKVANDYLEYQGK